MTKLETGWVGRMGGGGVVGGSGGWEVDAVHK